MSDSEDSRFSPYQGDDPVSPEFHRQRVQERVDEAGTVAVDEVDERERAFLRLPERKFALARG